MKICNKLENCKIKRIYRFYQHLVLTWTGNLDMTTVKDKCLKNLFKCNSVYSRWIRKPTQTMSPGGEPQGCVSVLMCLCLMH